MSHHPNICARCLLEPAHRGDLGRACLEYQRRTGRPRPADLIVRHADRISFKAALRQAANT